MKKGILSLCFALVLPFLGISQNAITLSVGRASATPGSTVCVNVSALSFKKIISMQYSMKWDSEVLEFTGVKEFRLPFLGQENFGLTRAKSGILTFVWIENNLKGVTLPDGSPIFQLCFKVKGKPGASSAITFSPQPTPYEVVNVYEQLLQLVSVKGEVKVK